VKISKHLTSLLIGHFDLEIPVEEIGHVEILGASLDQESKREERHKIEKQHSKEIKENILGEDRRIVLFISQGLNELKQIVSQFFVIGTIQLFDSVRADICVEQTSHTDQKNNQKTTTKRDGPFALKKEERSSKASAISGAAHCSISSRACLVSF
jgi:hypothetical protein